MNKKVYLNIALAIGIYLVFNFIKDFNFNNLFTDLQNFKKTKLTGVVENNLKQGEWKRNYETGELAEIKNFKNDTLNGLHIIYEKNGKFKLYEKYLMGVKIDTLKRYTSGSLNLIEFRDSLGQLQGEFRIYFENDLSQIGYYQNNKFHGNFKSYDLKTRKVSEIYEYTNGKKSGNWIYLNTEGDTIKIVEY